MGRGRGQLWSVFPGCFCPRGNKLLLLLCAVSYSQNECVLVNASVCVCSSACFLLLMVRTWSHTGRYYVKGRHNTNWFLFSYKKCKTARLAAKVVARALLGDRLQI